MYFKKKTLVVTDLHMKLKLFTEADVKRSCCLHCEVKNKIFFRQFLSHVLLRLYHEKLFLCYCFV